MGHLVEFGSQNVPKHSCSKHVFPFIISYIYGTCCLLQVQQHHQGIYISRYSFFTFYLFIYGDHFWFILV